jgi:hypothetical protein
MSKMFHGTVKNLQFRAISFIKHSTVNIDIKMQFINNKTDSVALD